MADIYLAARYNRRDELHYHRESLEGRGHRSVSDWLDGDAIGMTKSDIAIRDLRGIMGADVLVLFAEPMAIYSQGLGKGGMFTEFGFALGIAKHSPKLIVFLGVNGNIFSLIEQCDDLGIDAPLHCGSWADVLNVIDAWEHEATL